MNRAKQMIIIVLLAALQGCEKEEPISQINDEALLMATKSVSSQASKIPDFPGPGEFVAEVTNPYFAFARGKVFRYESETEDGDELILVEVTNQNKIIQGVNTTVVHDQVFLNGELIEDTFDWYAQDKSGNVWYFGEDTKEIENGVVVSTDGSWEAGVNGDAGIVMLANPKIGLKYKQEDAPDIAEDMAKVLSLSKTVTVPFGTFTACLQTADWTPLEPGNREFKYYKSGVGLVLELKLKGGRLRTELVSVN